MEFTLDYELRPEDVLSDQAIRVRRRRHARWRAVISASCWGFLAVVATAITVAFDRPSVVHGSTGAPSWLYPVDAVLWVACLYYTWLRWRLRPQRLIRRAWRQLPQLHGRHQDLVNETGVTCTAPDGTRSMIPWASVTEVEESGRAFYVLDQHGESRAILPKRGLADPEQVPALREFLNRSARHAVT